MSPGLPTMSSTTQNSAAPKFTGEFCHKVEGKNRITIPAGWRFDQEVKLYLIPKSDRMCISVMTAAEMERIEKKADELEPMERSAFLEMLGGCVREVTLDKGGRISLPEEFFPRLGLPDAREVWLAGATTTFNIWSLDEFEAKKACEVERQNALKRRLGI